AQIPLRHDPNRRSAPLTAQQERIAFMQELHPERVTYNAPSAHRLEGPLDPALLLTAVRLMVQRQAVLRTAIRGESGSYEQVVSDHVDVEMPVIDLSGIPEPEQATELMRQMQRIVDRPMDLKVAPLFRCALYRLSEGLHVFLFMPHHIIWDGWSFDLLYEELAACLDIAHAKKTAALPAIRATYLDYAFWQQEWMGSVFYAAMLQEWTERIARCPEVSELPTDVPRGASMSGAGDSAWVYIDSATVQSMREISRVAGVTLNMLCLGLYAAMLGMLCRSQSLTIGVPVRGRIFPEIEPVMGFFNNLLPLPLNVERGRSVVDFLGNVKTELIQSLRFQEIPFERLAAQPSMLIRARRTGLYQALFSFQDVRDRDRKWGSIRQSNVLILQKGATEDLGLWLMDGPKGLEGGLNYNADVYKPDTVQAMRDLYLEIVQRFVAEPNMLMQTLLDADSYSAMGRLRHLESRPDTQIAAPQDARRSRRPFSETERRLAGIWADLLGIPIDLVQPEDNFFDLGGDSLRAMEVIARMRRETGKAVNPRVLVFESLAQLAGSYDSLEVEPPVEAKAPSGFLSRFLRGGR
ncbi:MAG: non-ribosomal peptide synthetase, partial [Acidobacteriota bacterium]|nr:non-ribosomal peptide synthetase [Acidobacteriota bacterium]